MGMGGQGDVLAASTQAEKPSRPGGSQGWCGLVLKTLLLLRFNPHTIQSVASHHTVYTIPAHKCSIYTSV